jgi:hypothetical protein
VELLVVEVVVEIPRSTASTTRSRRPSASKQKPGRFTTAIDDPKFYFGGNDG